MTNLMKALVKSHAEEGLWMERVPVPEPGPDEVLIKVQKICDLRDGCAYLEMGRMVRQDRADPNGHGARILRRNR